MVRIPACHTGDPGSILGFDEKEYIVAFSIGETFTIVVSRMLHILLFYVSFESVLIFMFIIIGIWGSR